MGFILPKIKKVPGIFRTKLSKFLVCRDHHCINCGTCMAVCPTGVHQRPDGYKQTKPPEHDKCIGFDCLKTDTCCVRHCPRGALKLELDPLWETLGDARWPADLIKATWHQGGTGELPPSYYNYETGQSEGGFDCLHFKYPELSSESSINNDEIDTSLELNKRSFGPKITIPIPIYGGGMSFGSIGLSVMLARAKAAQAWQTFFSTGEGGYPEELAPYDDYIITQVATGLFGVSEETLQRVRFMEFKYAQGAKPGLGGHLLGDKNTSLVAKLREAVPGTSLFSPFPFHSVYSVEDHKKHVDWIKAINPNILVAVKVSTPTDIDMVAVGSYYAGAHIINLDGGYGGTGAAPEIAKKNIAMPIEYAIPKVHKFLSAEGIRDDITLIASGGIRSALDVAKSIALGADGVVIGTAELIALGCVRCGNCERGRGCPRGIATTDPELSPLINSEWGAQRIINMYAAWRKYWVRLLKKLGLKSFKELRGRMDLLDYVNSNNQEIKNKSCKV
ncbi:MAG: alpha-hydroxy-acid oxidizing protein [Planctomycetes bacterium]|nr:alpha-hydroxy-acid oxidizing protein [Planctomycetota bacterium]